MTFSFSIYSSLDIKEMSTLLDIPIKRWFFFQSLSFLFQYSQCCQSFWGRRYYIILLSLYKKSSPMFSSSIFITYLFFHLLLDFPGNFVVKNWLLFSQNAIKSSKLHLLKNSSFFHLRAMSSYVINLCTCSLYSPCLHFFFLETVFCMYHILYFFFKIL